jgi:hypothetical protein
VKKLRHFIKQTKDECFKISSRAFGDYTSIFRGIFIRRLSPAAIGLRTLKLMKRAIILLLLMMLTGGSISRRNLKPPSGWKISRS